MMNREPTDGILYHSIGWVRTPYINAAPYQPRENDKEKFYLELLPEYAEGLEELETFRYIYVLFHMHKKRKSSLHAHPPWGRAKEVGVFASRSPNRPNAVGLSIVKLLRIEGNIVHISGIDAFDKSPLLDIKPYIAELDSKEDANYGWVDKYDGRGHLRLHILGIPHKHEADER